MYAQPFVNWTQTEVDDPDSLRFQLDPNDHKVVPKPYFMLQKDTVCTRMTSIASTSSWTQTAIR
jgi:hypothetical protein